jgi:3-dehydroquinate synthase
VNSSDQTQRRATHRPGILEQILLTADHSSPNPKRVPIRTGSASYTATIGPGARTALSEILDELRPARTLLLSDHTVFGLHGATILPHLPESTAVATVTPGETSKSLATAGAIYDRLADARLGRDGLLIALGGGVIGDLGGFVAATWQRGIRFIQVPTTLEAAIDASVGGKTGLNHPAGKNLIGAFHQPVAVVVDLDFLATCTDRDYRAGLAESVKHAATLAPAFLTWHESNAPALGTRDAAVQTELIARNIAIKAEIVSKDEREAGPRMILNHGHTVGHALELEFGYALRHGECVALGMRVENAIAVGRGLLSPEDAARIDRLLAALGLPATMPSDVDPARILGACAMDKKNRAGRTVYMLLNGIGNTTRVDDVSPAELTAALQAIHPARIP